MARLHFHRGPIAEGDAPLFVHRLRQTRTRIGRTDDCDVVLPDDQVSRSHCLLDPVGEEFDLIDRSANGTWVNGERVVGQARLRDGDVLRFGSFHARLDLSDRFDAPTETSQPEARDEEILDVGADITAARPWLAVAAGPGEGTRARLRGARFGVGGGKSRVSLPDPALVENHVYLRLAMGRTMVEPGKGAAFLGPTRIRDITPLEAGEAVRIGSTEFTVQWETSRESPAADHFGEMVGSTEAMRRIFGTLRRMASHHAPILLMGESGTGKELAAKAVHEASPRSPCRFVAINCGAIPETLFDSELFGHEKGAFTGADQRRDGAFQRADGGTLFLDEVGELSPDAQVRLLRALESGEIRRVGSMDPSFPDVRLVAATNRDLPQMVKEGRFRADLYFRLAVLAVVLPPLRERVEDIPTIAQAIATRISPKMRLAPDALDALRAWPWPGNARELRNVLTRAWVLAGPVITRDSLQFTPTEEPRGRAAEPRSNSIADAERDLVQAALQRCGGNRSRAAQDLGIPRSSLLYKLKKWGLE